MWLKAPAPGAVRVEDGAGRLLATVTAGSDGVGTRTVKRASRLVARQGDASSLSCRPV